MMRMWHIELRANFANKEINDVMDQIVKNGTADIHATCALLADGARVEIVCYSDDFMLSRKELDWLSAKKTVQIQVSTGTATVTDTVDEEAPAVSDEMIEAMNELRKLRGDR